MTQRYTAQELRELQEERDRALDEQRTQGSKEFDEEYLDHVSQVVTIKRDAKDVARRMLAELDSWEDDPEIQALVEEQDRRAKQTILERIQADGLAKPPTIEEAQRANTIRLWTNLVAKCTNKKHLHYRHWGALGVTVHEPWILSFDAFVADVGLCPSPLYDLRRIAVDRGFEPGNVGWVEQSVVRTTLDGKHAGGRPKRGQEILLEYQGKMVTMPELSQLTGIKLSTIRARHAAGKSVEQITVPVRLNARGEAWNVTLPGAPIDSSAPVILRLQDLCKAKGVPYATVKARLKNGVPLGMALGPKKEKQTIEERRAKMRAYYYERKKKAKQNRENGDD